MVLHIVQQQARRGHSDVVKNSKRFVDVESVTNTYSSLHTTRNDIFCTARRRVPRGWGRAGDPHLLRHREGERGGSSTPFSLFPRVPDIFTGRFVTRFVKSRQCMKGKY